MCDIFHDNEIITSNLYCKPALFHFYCAICALQSYFRLTPEKLIEVHA